MPGINVLDASTTDREKHAVELVFEYLAATQREAGRSVPRSVQELPDVLRSECEDLASAYRWPGAMLVAYADGTPVGCVGLRPRPEVRTVEVKRLYVRPPHRSLGIGRLLMDHAHRLAAERGFDSIVLDVWPRRVRVVDFYRRLGYAEIPPYEMEAPSPMIYLGRPIEGFTDRHGIPAR